MAALGPQAPVLQLWHAWRAPLDAAREAALQHLRARGQRTRLCASGEFLPLLQTLNTLIADSLRGAPLPDVLQAGVWVVDGAERLSAEHRTLLERILAQFPELPVRLLLLSQGPLAPQWPAQAQALEVAWREPVLAAPAWQAEPDEARPTPEGSLVWVWGGVAAALVAVAAAGVWWGLGGATARPQRVVAAKPAVPASVPEAPPVLALASDAASAGMAQASAPVASASASAQAQPAASTAASAPVVVASAAASAAPAKTAPIAPWRAWVQGLPEGSYLVLHGQFASAREAEAFKAGESVLANARIVQAVWTAGQGVRYGVLTGPFRSPDRVSNYVQRLAWREQTRSIARDDLLKLAP